MERDPRYGRSSKCTLKISFKLPQGDVGFEMRDRILSGLPPPTPLIKLFPYYRGGTWKGFRMIIFELTQWTTFVFVSVSSHLQQCACMVTLTDRLYMQQHLQQIPRFHL